MTLIELLPESQGQLNSKLGGRIVRVDRFDPNLLSVGAETPASLRVTALKEGVTKMRISYEDGEKEDLVIWVRVEVEN